MAKRVICFALGGNIATQNASFNRLIENLHSENYRFFGAVDGFRTFETGYVCELNPGQIPKKISGFIAGAGRYTLLNKDETIDQNKLDKANEFFKKGKFDIAIGSAGDDHGKQMEILKKELEGRVNVYVINKTMDNDLGGRDGIDRAPYTDFTNGFQSAVVNGVKMIHQHFHGAWTNNLPYLVSHFSRDVNWTGIALAYWGLADKIIYGELPEEHPGHSIDKIYEIIREAQKKNNKVYGREFAMIIVPESTRIKDIQHESNELIDAHGHGKLQPELLANSLKVALETRYNLKTQTVGITYEMRNFKPTNEDIDYAERSANAITYAIRKGQNGLESIFKIREDSDTQVESGTAPDTWVEAATAPIEKVSQKRYASYYPKPFIDEDKFEVTDEIGIYYKALFGKRKSLSHILPRKLKIIDVFR